jgi:SAM-dependent methyltransferase
MSSAALPDTGERMLPECSAPYVFWEHVYRYKFAASFVRGKRVLDIACGEGYGTAALAACGAAGVVGVDVSPEACAHARRKYGIDARVGQGECIPLPDASLDLVVSFETVEHLTDPAAFVRECRRVLHDDGTLIISTPNRLVYSAEGHHNPFHVAEMDRTEFTELLRGPFDRLALYGQRPRGAGSWRLRAAFCEDSPYMRFPPLRGLRWLARRALSPGYRTTVPAEVREDPLRAIRAAERPGSWLVNPYVVRGLNPTSAEQPCYLIAAARP